MAFALGGAALWLLVAPLGGVTTASAQTDAYRCPLSLVIEDERIPPVGITELVFDVGYVTGATGFAGHGSDVDCSKLVESATAVFVDDDAGKLHVEFTSETGLSSLITALARCTTLSHSIPVASDFAVTLIEEHKLGGSDVIPPVPIELLVPELDDCELVTTTTSTTSTTTTSTTITTTSTTVTTTTSLPSTVCGDPTGDAATTATDALLTLNAAVGLTPCELCACDVDGSASVTASDALFLLSYAVGQPVSLDCPPCS